MRPKTHNTFSGKIPPGRPIVSGSGTNTEGISWFCDEQVKSQLKNIDSFIKDTPDILRKFNAFNDRGDLPENTIPISVDIESMYSNIPIDEGLAIFEQALERRSDKSVPTQYVMTLLRLVMMKNIFTFNNKAWLQLIGCLMGSRTSPTFACLFMAALEQRILHGAPQHLKEFIYFYGRFVDDLFFLWKGTWEQFLELHNFMNQCHPTIKFDVPGYDPETNSCNFLDINISVLEGKIVTNIYRKETDVPRSLLPSSSHPGHVTQGIV